jgi:hypothetical protein
MRIRVAISLLSLLFGAGQAAAAPTPQAKLLYQQARDAAQASYKTAHARCAAITGNPQDVCLAEAKAARVRTEEEAHAHYKNTLSAYTVSRMRIADAWFALEKTRCQALTGNEKDVCHKQAKANQVGARADARADKKAIEARTDARDDKRTAEYKVALEKCDAFAGAAKVNCVAAAKTQYGK